MHAMGVFRSEFKSVVASAWVRGKANGTSAQFVVWQRCPNPTVGKPMGSGAGLATKPSACLIKAMVAALTLAGGGHALLERATESEQCSVLIFSVSEERKYQVYAPAAQESITAAWAREKAIATNEIKRSIIRPVF